MDCEDGLFCVACFGISDIEALEASIIELVVLTMP